ncbi:MAG: DUF5661 family protein [bacterium]
MNKKFTQEEAKLIGEGIGVDFTKYDLEEFRMGLGVELEHGAHDPQTNVTNDDEAKTGKIAWAHLKEISDYYTRLDKMEKEAESGIKIMKIQFKKILIWVVIIYFLIGLAFAGRYLIEEYKTFECPMANGDTLTMSGISQDKPDRCVRRISSVRTLASAGGVAIFWPLKFLK